MSRHNPFQFALCSYIYFGKITFTYNVKWQYWRWHQFCTQLSITRFPRSPTGNATECRHIVDRVVLHSAQWIKHRWGTKRVQRLINRTSLLSQPINKPCALLLVDGFSCCFIYERFCYVLASSMVSDLDKYSDVQRMCRCTEPENILARNGEGKMQRSIVVEYRVIAFDWCGLVENI